MVELDQGNSGGSKRTTTMSDGTTSDPITKLCKSSGRVREN